MDSLWRQTVELPRFAPLERDANTDVLIIGGGMAGLLCAYELTRAGADCVLLEADRICGGVTENTTAKITAQHGLIYHKLLRRFGADRARLYLHANQEAVERYRQMCGHMDCEFQQQDNYVYAQSSDKVEQEMEALRVLGASAELVHSTPLPFPVEGAVCFRNQGQFHPLKFVAGLVEGLPIHERTKVLELKSGEAVCHGGTIRARHIIVATHFPMLNKHGSYFLKLHQHRSYVLAFKNAPEFDGMYVDEAQSGLSFRRYGELLLLGGGGHRTGKQGGGWRALESFARHYWPKVREAGRWATQDCMTLDDMPYVGRYSGRTPGLYVATGFNKWGMTFSMVAARLLTDLIQEKKNPYERLFSPSRSILHPQLAANAAQAVVGLLTPGPRCPHMGCVLKYNREEHSWDCPCHGSRFTREGQLINNPATDDKKM